METTEFNDAEFEEDMKEEIKEIDKVDNDYAQGVVIPGNDLPAIPKHTGSVIRAIDIDGTLKTQADFELLKKKMLKDNDFMYFGKFGTPTTKDDPDAKPYIKKEGWMKYKTAFGISVIQGKGQRVENEDSEGFYYMWIFPTRAVAPNGQVMDVQGACDSRKPFFSKKHGERINPSESDIFLTAQTVGYNRAVSFLIGGGEVSAEEMGNVVDSDKSAPAIKPPIQRERKVFEGNLQELDPQTYIITAPKSKYYNKTFLQTPSSYIQWTIEQLDSGRLDMTRFGYQNDLFKEFLQCCFKIRIEYENSKKEKKE